MNDDQASFDEAFAALREGKAPSPPAPEPAEPQAAEPAPAPAPEPAPEPAASEAPPTVEELRQQLRDAQHRERSSANRVSAFMRENNSLKQALDQLKQRVDQLGAAPAPKPAADAEAEQDVLTQAPDLESAVKRRVQSVTAALEQQVKDLAQRVTVADETVREARQVIEPIRQRSVEEQIQTTHQALDAQFTPKWRDDIRAPAFEAWITAQPPAVQQLYNDAITPEDSASVLARFYAGQRRTTPAPSAPAPAPAGTPNTERLRNAAGIAPRGNVRAPSGLADDDLEGHFAAAVRNLRKTG